MTLLDIAQGMRGRLRDGYSPMQAGVSSEGSAVETGTAVSDSVGGYVDIIMDGAPTDDPGYPSDFTFTVPCDAPISNGDRVSYISADGYGKAVALESLSQIAEDADAIATATNQHFWHRSTDPDGDGAGTGAFVTDETQDDFLTASAAGFPDYDPDTKPYRNILINSLGVLLRSALYNLASFTKDAVAFYDGNGNNADNITASFGSGGAVIGITADGESRVEVASSGMTVIDRFQGVDYPVAEVLVDGHRGDGLPITHYTFGERGARAVGSHSFVAGVDCDAPGNYSMATGHGAVADGDDQLAIGLYNVIDSTSAFIVGNGTADNARSNALKVDWSGNITAGGVSIPVATTTDTTISNIITAGTGITITEAHYCTWGKVAMLMVGLKRSSAISAGGAITIGTVASGHRPVTDAAGSSNTLNGWLSTGGNFTARNITGSQIAANTDIYISLTYLLP